MTKRPSSHILIWREALEGDASWGWTLFERPDYGKYFRRRGDAGFIHAIAHRALCDNFGAILRNVNVSVGWATAGGDRIEAMPAADVEEMVRRLRPLTIICPERNRRPLDHFKFRYASKPPGRLNPTGDRRFCRGHLSRVAPGQGALPNTCAGSPGRCKR
jgi:hypothetical protein